MLLGKEMKLQKNPIFKKTPNYMDKHGPIALALGITKLIHSNWTPGVILSVMM